MDSLELIIFREVVYTKSITQAAENLGYVQSNISAHIKKLENELSTALFTRSHTGVTLTKDGEKLFIQAEKIAKLFDETIELFQSDEKSLKIASTQTIAGYLLPKCIAELKTKHQDLKISLTTLQSNTFESQLSRKEIDCIITNQPTIIENARDVFHQEETLLLMAPSGCESIKDISSYSPIVNHLHTCPYRSLLLKWWDKTYASTGTILEVDTLVAIIENVKLGGVSLLPKHIVDTVQDITSFYLEELQGSTIHMWISKEKDFVYKEDITSVLIKTIK